MKPKLILLAVFLLSFHISKGQGGDGGLLGKCYIDSKTGDTIRLTTWNNVDFSSMYLLNFRMTRINSVFALELKYHFGASEPFTIAKGDSVWIKFVSGFKLVLYSNDSVMSVKGGAMIPGSLKGAITVGVSVKYNLSRPQMSVFAGNEIDKIRIFSSMGYKDIKWPEPSREGLYPPPSESMQAANLLLEKRRKYKVCEPDPEAVKVNKEDANKDNF